MATFAMCVTCVLCIVFLVYRPVLDAGFVWDDMLNFQERAWLYHGDLWKQYIFTGFNDWQFYFRPLGVALFVLQARLFDGAATPMHAVTLAMQLVNVALVMLLARQIAMRDGSVGMLVLMFAGLAFGLHPMLVETVTWIGCQFDQLQVMSALLGLLITLCIHNRWLRAVGVSFCFLLGAGFKESAAALPAIVALFDWLFRTDRAASTMQRLRSLLRDNWPSYLLLLIAGLAYLALRKAMMGSVAGGATLSMFIPDWTRLESIAYVYLKYWTVILGIPTELNPLHPVAAVSFGENAWLSLLRVFGALAVASLGILTLFRRLPVTAGIVVAASLYLVLVLGFFPGHFDDSLYHERYAIGAIALTAALLPSAVHEWSSLFRLVHVRARWLAALAAGWIGFAVINVRATIPLWSDSTSLWQWAVLANPDNGIAMGNLISAHIRADNPDAARTLVQQALAHDLVCDYCYLNGFVVAVSSGDLALAEITLARVRDSEAILSDRILAQHYWATVGFLELRLGNPGSAEQALRNAIALEPLAALDHLRLAEALSVQGKADQARREAELAVQLASPAEAERTRLAADYILSGVVVFSEPFPSMQGDSSDDSHADPR